MAVQISTWDAAEHLDTDEAIAAYLSEVMALDDPQHLVQALNTIARAHGMTQIARNAGIGRQALYKSLGETGNPTLTTLMSVMKALGLKLQAKPG